MPLPPVPPHARRFRTDDLDEVRSTIRHVDGEHWRVAHGNGPLGFDLARVGGGMVKVGWGACALAQTVRGTVRNPCLHFPINAASHYSRGRHTLDVAPGAAVFLAEETEFTRHSVPGAMFAIQLDRQALAAEVRARHPAMAGNWSRQPREVEPGDPRQQALRAALADLVASTTPQAAAAGTALREARVLEAVADLIRVQRSIGEPASALSARRLAVLEDWIESHFAEPLTLGSLCEVAGVGERALQMAFRSRRGMSPMRFVAERRLAAAHRRLAQGDPDDDVTTIATGVGFSHLGRFAVLYRQTYGEPPSLTLRRRAAIG